MIVDIKRFVAKFGFKEKPLTRDQLKFRMSLLKEEYDETVHAFGYNDPEEFVDGMIDIIVIALGTLEIAGVNIDKAWSEVMRANMSKERGVKSSRPESGGFDVMKPEGWKAPSHKDNHGVLDELLKD